MVTHRTVTLYVEGGGDANILKTACRKGFADFLEKAGLKNHMPRIFACGSRQQAFKDFCAAVACGEDAYLLVDSEEVIAPAHQRGADGEKWLPWHHLKVSDGWDMPPKARNVQCHLMAVLTESWFLADREALEAFFGQGFKDKQLPPVGADIESVPKQRVFQALERATGDCKHKAKYGKGEHSFKILARIDPTKVAAAAPWAKRFIDVMKKEMVGKT